MDQKIAERLESRQRDPYPNETLEFLDILSREEDDDDEEDE